MAQNLKDAILEELEDEIKERKEPKFNDIHGKLNQDLYYVNSNSLQRIVSQNGFSVSSEMPEVCNDIGKSQLIEFLQGRLLKIKKCTKLTGHQAYKEEPVVWGSEDGYLESICSFNFVDKYIEII